jgi:hypothetical protein
MGLSNILTGGDGATAEGAAPSAKPDFGDRMGDYFESKYPISGGLAQAVFGQNAQPQAAPTATPATAPSAAMPNNSQPDYSQMIAQNAQPQQAGGGLAALLKLFA